MKSPTLKTKRLVLRQITMDDVPALFELMQDEQVNKFLPWFPHKTPEETANHIKSKQLTTHASSTIFYYGVCLKADNRLIGYINISSGDSFDLGYALAKSHWGKGYITEGVIAVIKQAEKVGLPYLTATHDRNNPVSGRIMEKAGMKYCYSYEELWQPKNHLVVFRMYQLNLDGNQNRIYMHYWNIYPNHFIEEQINKE